MTNNFNSLKANQSSQRFSLVRLEPGRYANDDLVSIGGGKYTLTFKPDTVNPGIISKVQANGVNQNKIAVVANPTDWSYSETTGLLTIYSTPSSSNIIVIFYYLFYTGDKFQYTYETPDDNTTTRREWIPRLKSYPSLSSTMENAITGQISISSSSLVLINNSFEFQYYLSSKDTFSRKSISIWNCIDDVGNVQKVYQGTIVDLSLSRTEVTINFEDHFSVLSLPCYFGDNSSENYFNLNDNTSLEPSKNMKPIPMFFGIMSSYSLQSYLLLGATLNFAQAEPLTTKMNEAACTNFSALLTTSVNRVWGLGRVKDDIFDCGINITSTTYDSTNFVLYIYLTAAMIANFRIGDTFQATRAGVAKYLRVMWIDRVNNFLLCGADASWSANRTLTAGDPIVSKSNAVQLAIAQGSKVFYPQFGRDYSVSTSATSGGNKYVYITFTNNFEANLMSTQSGGGDLNTAMTALNPQVDKVYFSIKVNQTNINHANVVKFLLQSAGLTVLASSITAAAAALAVNASFSIPMLGESNYGSYFSYLQILCQSAFGYLTHDNAFNVAYNLFATPAGTNTISDDVALADSFKTILRYKDIVTQMLATNAHISASEPLDTSITMSVPASTASVKSTKAQYLHGIINTVNFVHVLESISTVLANIMKVREERYAEYSYDAATANIDSNPGDDVLLSKTGLLGNESSKSAKIMQIKKDPGKTQVSCSDLYAL